MSYPVPAGRFRMWRSAFSPTDDPWRLYCLLGDNRPRVIRGFSGWGQKSRTGRRNVTGRGELETPAIQVDLLIEDRHVPFLGGTEDKVRSLERLCGFDLADDTAAPVVQWIGNVPHDFNAASQNEWVVEGNPEWGDSNADGGGTLLWQKVTIVLALYSVETLALPAAKGFARHEMKAGWDLRDFARRFLDDATRWQDVARLNADNSRCPSTPGYKVTKPVTLLVPPREPKAKRGRR